MEMQINLNNHCAPGWADVKNPSIYYCRTNVYLKTKEGYNPNEIKCEAFLWKNGEALYFAQPVIHSMAPVVRVS